CRPLHPATPRIRSPRQFRPLDLADDVRRLCAPAFGWILEQARGNPYRRLGQTNAELGLAGLSAIRSGGQSVGPDPTRHRLYGRLPAPLVELPHVVYLYGHDADTEQHERAAVELAYAWTRLPGSNLCHILN